MVPLTRHGWREMLIGSVVLVATAAVLGTYLWIPLSLIVLPILIWLFAFFRDPHRVVPTQQHAMVSPADGVVSDITELDGYEPLHGPVLRIGIFLSVFNVHMNRSPCDGRVIAVNYRKGKFINALSHAQASEQNESNTVILAEPKGDRVIAVVKQIVGLIARRIVCSVKDGDRVERGQRIGMIKFGSRTELYIPKWLSPQVKVAVGDKVRGAMDIVAVLGHPIATETRTIDTSEVEPLVPRETPA